MSGNDGQRFSTLSTLPIYNICQLAFFSLFVGLKKLCSDIDSTVCDSPGFKILVSFLPNFKPNSPSIAVNVSE